VEDECQSLTPPPIRRHSSDPSSYPSSDPSRFSISEKLPLSDNLSLPSIFSSIESYDGAATTGDTRTAIAHVKLPSMKLRPKRSAIRIDTGTSFGG